MDGDDKFDAKNAISHGRKGNPTLKNISKLTNKLYAYVLPHNKYMPPPI